MDGDIDLVVGTERADTRAAQQRRRHLAAARGLRRRSPARAASRGPISIATPTRTRRSSTAPARCACCVNRQTGPVRRRRAAGRRRRRSRPSRPPTSTPTARSTSWPPTRRAASRRLTRRGDALGRRGRRHVARRRRRARARRRSRQQRRARRRGVAAGASRVWLADESYALTPLPAPIGGEIWAVRDANDDGLLDLLGVAAGAAGRWLGKGSRGYHWKTFTTRAQQNAGDQRINSFGVGGEIEVKAGLLWQKQVLARRRGALRPGPAHAPSTWRASSGRTACRRRSSASASTTRSWRSSGSRDRARGCSPTTATACAFVTDFLWRSPLGLRINAQDTAGVTQTEDWVRIRGDQLAPRDGRYDVRITAELWETHFFDHVSLLVVDHPDGHRGLRRRALLGRVAAAPARCRRCARRAPVARAIDDAGRDVTDARRARATAAIWPRSRKGAYQGIADAARRRVRAARGRGRGPAARARGRRLGVSHRQQHQPGRRAGSCREAERAGARCAGRGGRLARGGARTSASRRARTRACSSTWRPARERAGSGCAPTSRSTGTVWRWPSGADVPLRTRAAGARSRRAALPRVLADVVAARRRARDAGLRRARQHDAALARPRRLPHALRRRAGAAGRRGRSLRDHERRRRAAPRVPASGPRPRPAGAATSC